MKKETKTKTVKTPKTLKGQRVPEPAPVDVVEASTVESTQSVQPQTPPYTAYGKDLESRKPTTSAILKKIFNPTSHSYPTNDAGEYNNQLNLLNFTDLQHECIRVGIAPRDTRSKMLDGLAKAFREHNLSLDENYRDYANPPAHLESKITSSTSQKLKDLFSS